MCNLLENMHDGASTLTYHDIRKMWSVTAFPFRQLDINRSLTDRYPTSWSVQRGHHFYLWTKVTNTQHGVRYVGFNCLMSLVCCLLSLQMSAPSHLSGCVHPDPPVDMLGADLYVCSSDEPPHPSGGSHQLQSNIYMSALSHLFGYLWRRVVPSHKVITNFS
jgi:hypothetical protein